MTTTSRLRTCIGCRRRNEPSALWRVVRDQQGELAVSKHSVGRGAWICASSASCLRKARTTKAFERAFRAPVGAEALDRLEKDLGLGHI